MKLPGMAKQPLPLTVNGVPATTAPGAVGVGSEVAARAEGASASPRAPAPRARAAVIATRERAERVIRVLRFGIDGPDDPDRSCCVSVRNRSVLSFRSRHADHRFRCHNRTTAGADSPEKHGDS